MAEANKAFTYLQQNAPKWLSDLSRLERHVEEKQHEMSKLPETPPKSQPLARNGSVKSVKDLDFPLPATPPDSSSMSPPPHAESARAASAVTPPSRNRLVKRSRKPGSVLSNISAPPKFRSRNMVIVYYDAEIQRAFDKLVREIGTGRNLIRKGKMALRVDAFSTKALDDEKLYSMVDGELSPTISMSSMSGFRRAGARSAGDGDMSDSPEHKALLTAYEKADKALEKAQELCERAAHQFLRDGDCSLETEKAKEAFHEAIKVSTEELERLKTSTDALPPKSSDSESTQSGAPSSSGLAFTSIEVDEDEETPLALPTLRLTSRMGPRRGQG